MDMLEEKKVRGFYTYEEALRCTDGCWRLPTVFELKELLSAKKGNSRCAQQRYWSASPYAGIATLAWNVHFNYGSEGADFKAANLYLCLVRGGDKFDFTHAVCQKEVDAYKDDGTLPDWHPPFKIKK